MNAQLTTRRRWFAALAGAAVAVPAAARPDDCCPRPCRPIVVCRPVVVCRPIVVVRCPTVVCRPAYRPICCVPASCPTRAAPWIVGAPSVGSGSGMPVAPGFGGVASAPAMPAAPGGMAVPRETGKLADPAGPSGAVGGPPTTGQFRSPSGKVYRFRTAPAVGFAEAAPAPDAAAGAAGSSDAFVGHDRKAAKISIAGMAPEPPTSLENFLASLPSDNQMMALGIPRGEDSDRVAQENRNVTVSAFVFASKRESDNDFHVIVGTNGTPESARFFNVEISGLPPTAAPAFGPLKAARKQFKDFFADQLPSGQRYDIYEEPIPVRIAGSLFFDVDHPAGAVGPAGLKPESAWEIHPVVGIEFE